MGAIKANYYTEIEWMSSNFSRAFSHPARLRIIQLLLRCPMNNMQLAKQLDFDRRTVKDHLTKLLDAELIVADYLPHLYVVSVNEEKLDLIKFHLRLISMLEKSKKMRFIR